MIAEPGVGDRGHAGGAVAGEVDGNAVGFAVVQGGEHPFAGGHGGRGLRLRRGWDRGEGGAAGKGRFQRMPARRSRQIL